ncbi:hypothetical protein BJ944DRAFT_271409 [Cunninghamella echinulata]|nr:hypothetical protein BJ944DRAFT_271409 [Cunninghamella echinulata]
MTVPFINRVYLYASSLIPPLLFYLFTEIYTTQSDTLLVLINILQFLLPLIHDGSGTLVDNAYNAVMGMVLGISMSFYIQERRRLKQSNQPINRLAPFYHVLSRWNDDHYEVKMKNEKNMDNEKEKDTDMNDGDDKPESINKMSTQSTYWLIKALFYMALTVPVMSFFDGILRTCQLPPHASTLSFWAQFPMPWITLVQYFIVGFTLFLHVGIVDVIYRLLITLRLKAINLYVNYYSPVDIKLLNIYYKDTQHILSQPFIFNHPWFSHSIYDLWSRRWHQIFRPGFSKLFFFPVLHMFPPQSTLGRILASMAVFLGSGLFHDYILTAMMGYSNINRFPGILGQQTIFFLLQGIATVVSAPKTPWSYYINDYIPLWLSRIMVYAWLLITAPLFVIPYLLIGLHQEAEVPFYPRSFDPFIANYCPYGHF